MSLSRLREFTTHSSYKMKRSCIHSGILHSRAADPTFLRYKQWCNSFPSDDYVKLNCLNPSVDLSWLKQQNFLDKYKLQTTFSSSLVTTGPKHSIPSIGVRSSLRAILSYLKEVQPDVKAIIPYDVYPVYHRITREIMPFTTYQSTGNIATWRHALKTSDQLAPNVLLVVNPASPSGKYLTNSHMNILERWMKNPNNWIVVDAVYNYTNNLSRELRGPRVFWCTSMSKTYLTPEHNGIISIEDEQVIKDLGSFVEPPIETSDNIINNNPLLPAQQQLLFDARWQSLQRRYPFLIETTPDNGYMHIVNIPFKILLDQHKIIGVPSSVFGSQYPTELDFSDKTTVITCLNYEPELDDYYYFTTVANFAACYDKYSRMFCKNNTYTYPNKFFLCPPNNIIPGIQKAQRLLAKLGNFEDQVVAIRTHQPIVSYEREFPTVLSSEIHVDAVSIIENGFIKRVTVEDVYSLSLKLNNPVLSSWTTVIPRTISILPIAKGCQAKCSFCFSHGSVSVDQQTGDYQSKLPHYIERALHHGVKRAVITGGGEATMMPHEKLLQLITQFNRFPTVVMITNGYKYAVMNEDERLLHLSHLAAAGLTVLSISRHGTTTDENAKIMHLSIDSEKVALSAKNLPLKVRWVCVLQKGGVHDRESLEAYLSWVASTGVSEICFKELYVSSSYESVYHDTKSNEYSRENQVSLSIILDFFRDNNWTLVSKLPWGSPVYEGVFQGHKLQIAAYTEPSVYWERSNGICRSWNVMSDGTCYASLETLNSVI